MAKCSRRKNEQEHLQELLELQQEWIQTGTRLKLPRESWLLDSTGNTCGSRYCRRLSCTCSSTCSSKCDHRGSGSTSNRSSDDSRRGSSCPQHLSLQQRPRF